MSVGFLNPFIKWLCCAKIHHKHKRLCKSCLSTLYSSIYLNDLYLHNAYFHKEQPKSYTANFSEMSYKRKSFMLVVFWIWLLLITHRVSPSFGFFFWKILSSHWRDQTLDQVGDMICILFCYLYISHRRIIEWRQKKQR